MIASQDSGAEDEAYGASYWLDPTEVRALQVEEGVTEELPEPNSKKF